MLSGRITSQTHHMNNAHTSTKKTKIQITSKFMKIIIILLVNLITFNTDLQKHSLKY